MMTSPTLPPDHGEFWKTIRTAWLADPYISQLLSPANLGGAIYLEMPHSKQTYPFLVMKPTTRDFPSDVTYLGECKAHLKIDSFSTDRYWGEKVFAVFESQWSIPRAQVSEFQSTNWRCTAIDWTNPIAVGQMQVSNIDVPVWHFSCEGRFRIMRRTF